MLGAQGTVWVLDRVGQLHRLTDRGLTREPIDAAILDIAVSSAGTLLALRNTQASPLVVERDATGEWKSFADSAMSRFDVPVGFAVHGQTVAVYAKVAVHIAQRGGVSKRVLLRGDTLGTSLQPSLALTSDSNLYAGKNLGEFGGGLFHADLRTGLVRAVQRRDGKDICAGPLNRDCDAVTATLTDPDDSRCVIAAVGLWHFSSHGRILRVCGDSVTVVFERRCPGDTTRDMGACSEAVFGLAADAEGYVAVLGFSVLRFRAGRPGAETQFPKAPEADGTRYSFDIPGLAVLWSNVNWRASVSGPTPLVAVRR